MTLRLLGERVALRLPDDHGCVVRQRLAVGEGLQPIPDVSNQLLLGKDAIAGSIVLPLVLWRTATTEASSRNAPFNDFRPFPQIPKSMLTTLIIAVLAYAGGRYHQYKKG